MITLLLLACSGEPEPVPEPPTVAEPQPVEPAFQPDAQLAAALAGVPAEWKSRQNPRAGDPQALAEGEALYAAGCATCHGVNGDGDGPAARALPQPPSDFTDPDRWAATTDGEKAWLIREGIPRTSMAPRDLDQAATWAVLAHIGATFHKDR